VNRQKGAFDAVKSIALANENYPLRFRLTIIGGFASQAENRELHELILRLGLQSTVEILGFVSAERKFQALRDADLFCFPSYYLAEGQPASLIEAMAFGLPIVTTRWRAIPEMLPEDYTGFVSPKSPGQIAEKLKLLATSEMPGQLREIFMRRFTVEQHIAKIARAFRSVETG
jgi:glycosyltransferase involved in cell wall biosynthesis